MQPTVVQMLRQCVPQQSRRQRRPLPALVAPRGFASPSLLRKFTPQVFLDQ